MARKRRKRQHKVHKLSIVILDDRDFNKEYSNAKKCHAMWDAHTSSIFLRASRKGIARFQDFMHECKHVWVDLVDDED